MTACLPCPYSKLLRHKAASWVSTLTWLHARGCDYCVQLLEVACVLHQPAEAAAGLLVHTQDPLGCTYR